MNILSKNESQRSLYIVFFCCCIFSVLCTVLLDASNENTNHNETTDSMYVLLAEADTTKTLEPDFLLLEEIGTTSFDSLSYEADMLYYFVEEDMIILTGNAQVIYQSSTINANTISLSFEKNQAIATGNIMMQDNDQLIIGQSASFDIESQTGFILDGASRFEQGFYYGREIRKVGDDVYDLDYGCFTTCDALHPHFEIRARTMRLYRDEVMVGRPIIFYVNEFPILALPYAAVSIKSGRKSGFLMPQPGYSSRDGKKFEDIGYYYVFSDYADVKINMDFLEKTGYNFRTELIYLDRYKYNGRYDARYSYTIQNPDRRADDWYMRYSHFHRLPEKATFDVNINFETSRTWENDVDVNERLKEQVSSSISWRKPFFASSFSALASYVDNKKNNTQKIVLPSFSYSLPSRPIHEFIPNIPDHIRREEHWWKNFSMNWQIRGAHEGTITSENPTFNQIIWKNDFGSSQHHAGLRQNISFSHNTTTFGWLRLNNSLSYQDAVFDRDRNDKKLVHGYQYSTNSTATFNLYGTKRYNRGPIDAARHILTPSASFRYSPDFTENQKFYNFGGISLPAGRKSRVLNLSLEQKWQFRLIPDELGQERRLNDLFVFRNSLSYDLEKKVQPWSDINHNFSINPGSYELFGVLFSINQNFSTTQKTYENFNINSWRAGTNLNLSGDANYTNYFPLSQNDFVTNNLFRPDTTSVAEQQIMSIQDIQRLQNPGSWSLSSNFDYNNDRRSRQKIQNLRNNLSVKITQNWSVSYSNYYDIVKQDMIFQTVTVTRDLHCWKIDLRYTQSGDIWDIRINLFNLVLPELRVPYNSRS